MNEGYWALEGRMILRLDDEESRRTAVLIHQWIVCSCFIKNCIPLHYYYCGSAMNKKVQLKLFTLIN
jgi:hypothetical protein